VGFLLLAVGVVFCGVWEGGGVVGGGGVVVGYGERGLCGGGVVGEFFLWCVVC